MKNNKKYYNFETMFLSLRDALRVYLKENKIYYELSQAGKYYHFEILADETQAENINCFLDSITITEEKA